MADDSSPTASATERWLATLRTKAAGAVASTSPSPVVADAGSTSSRASINAMIDQGAAALAKHAGPILVNDVLPEVQKDERLQRNVGSAAGSAIGEKIAPWVAIAAGALLIMAGVSVMRFARERAAPKT